MDFKTEKLRSNVQITEQGNLSTELIRLGDFERRLFVLMLEQKFLTYELILKWFAPDDLAVQQDKRSKLYYRVYRLVNAGYLKKHCVDGFDLYILTQKGREAVSDINRYNLPLISVSELDTIRHDLLTADIRHYLESHGAVDWVSDRTFRLHADKLPQIPDGACTVRDRSVFVEVELSRKSKDRYDKIAEIYMGKKGPDRVLYFYNNDAVVEYLKILVRDHQRIGFFRYEDGMRHSGTVTGTCASEETTLAGFLGLS